MPKSDKAKKSASTPSRRKPGHADPRPSEKALPESRWMFSTLMSNLPGMVYRCRNDKDWKMEFVSEGCLELTGYPAADLLHSRKIAFGSLIHPDDQGWLWEKCQRSLAARQPCRNEYRIVTATGEEKWVWDQAEGIYTESGELLAVEGFITDITQRKKAEEAVQESNRFNQQIIASAQEGIIVYDQDLRYRVWNRFMEEQTGLRAEQVLGKHPSELFPILLEHGKYTLRQENIEEIKVCLQRALAGETVTYIDVPYVVKSTGQTGWKQAQYSPLRNAQGEIIGVIATVRDITDRKAQEAVLEHQALHDSLTDLPNRTLVRDRLIQAIHTAQREKKPAALLLMDLDRFKDVNDALGHHHGDLLLKQVGARVRGVLRESDTIARLGGDEFAILFPGTDVTGATVAARKIVEALDRPFVLEGFFLEVGASIGIALFPEQGEDPDTLMRRADVAMYQAKQSGSGYAVYVSEHDPHSPRRLALMTELRHSIERQELLLYYQPKIDLKSKCTAGAEALVRWRHPREGLILPERFITLAEHTGFIKPLALWVLREAVRQCRIWQQSGDAITMAVNLSARNLQDLQLPDQIAEILETERLDPSRLELEITESAIMMDPGRVMEILKRLRATGIRFSIDDFGAGYSSLGYLKKLPVSEVKIDKSFVTGMAAHDDDLVIVRSTIDLAHNLGLRVVAEGVENQEILERLLLLGCDAAQGYFLCRPAEADELDRWLKESVWGLGRKPA